VLNVVASPEVENVTRLSIEQMDTPSLFSRYDLTLTAQESGGVLRFKLDFPADRFDPPAGRVLLHQLRTLLRSAVADPTVRLLGEPALAAPAAPAAPSTPHLSIAGHAADPDLIAVVDGGGRHSYRWLSLATDRVAEDLVRHGVTATDRLGVVRRPNAAFVAALAGAAKVGVAGTVIETDDPALTGPLGLTTVLDPSPAGPPAAGTIDLSSVLPTGADATAPASNGTVATPDWAAERFGFGPPDRFVVLASRPGHLMSAMGSAFGAGATLVIPDRAFGDDVDALTAWLRDNAITVAYLDPSILRVLSARPPAGGLPALRCVVIDNAGDLLPRDIVAVRTLSPGCRCVSVYRVGADGRPLAFSDVAAELDPDTAPVRVRLGTPLPGGPIALRRPSGEAAAIGELAEIWNGPDRTGDLGRVWPDGCLEFVGQSGTSPTNDAMDTVSVLRDVPGVRDAVVTEHADGDGTTALLGYVAGPDPELGTIAIQQYLKARLPDYLVPRHLFVLDRLPRTPWGGYDLRALPRPTRDGSEGDTYAPPRTPMEGKLTSILEELLDIKRVGIYDSFFELGGFSMLATRLITRIRDAFGVLLAVRDVFESPTVDELARLVVRTQVEQAGLDDVEALLAEIEEHPVTTRETT
jgi:phosphopantetheine binding protein